MPAFRKVSRPAYRISLKADDYPAAARIRWTMSALYAWLRRHPVLVDGMLASFSR